MEKPLNAFAVIREKQNRDLSAVFHLACEYIAKDCTRCPLQGEKLCAEKQIPPKMLEKDKHGICADWVSLYFRVQL